MFPSPSQQPRGSIASSTGSSFSRTSPIVEIKHATPPRPPLPSSPSSHRLREIAPSPLRILPSSSLRYSPESPTHTHTTSASSAASSSQGRVLEYERERSSTRTTSASSATSSSLSSAAVLASNDRRDDPSRQGVTETDYAPQRPRRYTGDTLEDLEWPDDIPLIFDDSGVYKMPAGRFPDDADAEALLVEHSYEREQDEETMTAGEYVRAHYARKVMVDFRTDVFSPTSSTNPRCIDTPPTTAQGDAAGITREREGTSDGHVALRESFATFGRHRSDQSVLTITTARRDTDAFSVSLYEHDDNRNQHPDFPQAIPDDNQQRHRSSLPHLDAGYEDSPAGSSLELITPDHPHAVLPISQEHETPTAKPHKGKHKKQKSSRIQRLSPTAQGLQLTLDPLDTFGRPFEDLRGVDAGVTPGPGIRRPSVSEVERVPSIPAGIVKRASPPGAHITDVPEDDIVDSTPRPQHQQQQQQQKQDDPTLGLASFERSTYVEIEVDQDGAPGWTTRMPVRRISKPEVWQAKEEKALAKAVKWNDPPPKPQPFQQTGCVVLGQPPRERDKWVFDATPEKLVPVVRSITVNGRRTENLLSQKVCLNIGEFGVYHVSGYDQWDRVEWQFEYLVIHRTSDQGHIMPDDRIVVPMHVYAATSFFEQDRELLSRRADEPFQTLLMGERMPEPILGRPSIPKPTPPLPTKRARMPTPTSAPRRNRHETSPPKPQARPPSDHPFTDPRNIRTADNTPAVTPISPEHMHLNGILVGSTVSAGSAGPAEPISAGGTTPSTANATSSSSSGGEKTGRVSGFLHKFGAKSKSRADLRQQQQQMVSPTKDTSPDDATAGRAESIKSTKTRGRAASLLQKMARPFTPPTAMDKDLPPVPKLSPGASQHHHHQQSPTTTHRLTPMKSLSSLHPNTSPRYATPPVPVPVPPLPTNISMPRSAGLPPTHLTNAAVVRAGRHHASGSLDFRSSAHQPGTTTPVSATSIASAQSTASGAAPPSIRGLAPPVVRPILRKRPSTADPAVPDTGFSSRLVPRKPM